MSSGLGNELNEVVRAARFALFAQGELAQLSHIAFEHAAKTIREGQEEELTIQYPIGYKPTKEPMVGTSSYNKDDLIGRYALLAHTQVPVNGIYQLATIIEAMLADLIRRIVVVYPGKVSQKRQMPVRRVLDAQSLEEVRLRATEGLLQDLTYKSPREFAEETESLLSINLLECPAYHVFIEMKATRDVYIHNRGIANEIYLAKAGSHARVRAGEVLPVTQIYFLEVYEACLQLSEWLERALHSQWHSAAYEARQLPTTALPPGSPTQGSASG